MKISLSAVIICLTVVAALPGCTTAEKSGNWKILRQDAYHHTFSYDPGSVQRTPTGTVTARAKSDGSPYLYEIDCANRKMRILEGLGADPARWVDIVTGSGDRLLYNEVCRGSL